MDRRAFIQCLGWLAAGGVCLGGPSVRAEDVLPGAGGKNTGAGKSADERFVRPAMFWDKAGSNVVQCRLCPRQCRVAEGERGHCGVRENRGGEYVTLVYGRAVAAHNDPIEKKPFNHFLPGTTVFSVAAAGCNIHCKFCQNWQISQARPEDLEAQYLPPEAVAAKAKELGSPSVAFTYSEPTIFYEYMFDTARLAKAAGLRPVVVSNGFIMPEAVRALAPHLAAYKVDFKAYSDDYYQSVCQGRLDPVLETLKTLKGLGPWVELVNLVLPTLNDQEPMVRGLAGWVRDHLGPMTPVHFTRFHPMYKIRDLPPTPVETLIACHGWAKAEGLKYPYVGNVPGLDQENTWCHQCGELLIERSGLWAVEAHLKDGRCPKCGTAIPGVWS
jgi:pyruvate formate lyase activating enzyme